MSVVSVRFFKLYCVTGELAVNDCLDGIHFKRKSFYLKLDMTVITERTETRLYYLFYFSFQLEVSKKK